MQRLSDPEPAPPVDLAISEPPIAPVVVSFASSPEEEAEAGPPARAEPRQRQLSAWAIDASLLVASLAANVAAAAALTGRDPVALVVHGASSWLLLAAAIAFAAPAAAVALCGRTAGMALTGLKLQTLDRRRPSIARALVRALLAVAFAAPGLFGFALALFDGRCRTLQDRLCRCVAVVD